MFSLTFSRSVSQCAVRVQSPINSNASPLCTVSDRWLELKVCFIFVLVFGEIKEVIFSKAECIFGFEALFHNLYGN